MNGYIYIRIHPSYDAHDVCKMGIASNIPERDTQYATGEVKRGIFDSVFEIPIEKMRIIEGLLQNEFYDLNIKYDAGTEFYNKKIISLIEPCLIKLKIQYKKLTKQEIDDLVRCKRTPQKIDVSYVPRNYQNDIIDKSVIYFEKYDKGILVLMCGVGKTLISLWITQKLNSNTILIGVPNKLLLKQWEGVIRILFQNIPCLIVEGGLDIENIAQFFKNNQKRYIVITTYSSCYKVYHATSQLTRFKFDMKILDEVHHLTTNNIQLTHTTKKYIEMLNIPSIKQVSLTATLKQLENMCDDNIVVSNDNIEYFGEIIDRKSLLWAINENIICDYDIQTIYTDEDQIEQQLSRFCLVKENDKRLFLSAYTSLKSISDRHSHHLLIYSNNKDNSLELIHYIKMLLTDYFDIPELYYSNYHSEMKPKNQKEIINNFEKAKFGIITCVYCLGEGWDFPLLDGVVFAENMSSNIRIVQSALRACRKNNKDIHKKAKIILPILKKDDWLENTENSDLKKVEEVIRQMGLEDETIVQKIKVSRIDIEKQKPKPKQKKEGEMNDEFGEYDEELTQKLRLKTTKRIAFGITYKKTKKIITEKLPNMRLRNKETYYNLCERDNRLSKEPEIIFKGQFTNWIDFLGIERVYYDFETCKDKIRHYLKQIPEFKKSILDLSSIVEFLCKKDENFPPNNLWLEYYEISDLGKMITIPLSNKKKLKILN